MKKRRIKLINARLQLKLVFVFAATALVAMFVQALFLGSRLSDTARLLPADGESLRQDIPMLIGGILVVSVFVFLPVIVLVGIHGTFKVAGPLYRFTQYLEAVARGLPTRPCSIRKGDQLQELCNLINEVTEPLRVEPEEAEPRKAA
jgi:hypothetical protein